MNSIVANYPLPCLLAALLLGMISKWVLDLFFLRARLFELERLVTQRDRELADLRHEHGRVLTDLKNRLTELDATQKAKTVLNGTLSARETELAESRRRAAALDVDLAAARADVVRTADESSRAADEVRAAGERAATLAAELEGRTNDLNDTRLRLERVGADELAARETAARSEAAFRSREAELGRDLETAASVHEALQAAVQARDAELAAAKAAAGESEEKLAENAATLDKAKRDADAAAKSRKSLEKELADAKAATKEAAGKAADDGAALAKIRAEAEAATRQIALLEKEVSDAKATVKQRELALAELERKAAEYQAAFDDAARENEKLSKDFAAAKAAVAARPEKPAAPVVDPALLARVASLEGELARVGEARTSVEAELGAVSESHARLERELAAAREQAATLEARLEAQPAELAEVNKDVAVVTLLADLDQLSRERNAMAAELAALRAALPHVAKAEPREPRAPKAKAEPAKEFVAACPQHLSDVKGIGPAFETRLYAAGIGSYWDLSRLTDRELAVILELEDSQAEQLDGNAIRADAARLAAETHSVGRKWSQEPPDDLEPIEGIGRVFEKKLYDAGICTFAALAAATPEKLEEICPGNASRRPNYAAWIEQARSRAEEREA